MSSLAPIDSVYSAEDSSSSSPVKGVDKKEKRVLSNEEKKLKFLETAAREQQRDQEWEKNPREFINHHNKNSYSKIIRTAKFTCKGANATEDCTDAYIGLVDLILKKAVGPWNANIHSNKINKENILTVLKEIFVHNNKNNQHYQDYDNALEQLTHKRSNSRKKAKKVVPAADPTGQEGEADVSSAPVDASMGEHEDEE